MVVDLTNSNTGGENHFTIITISDTPIDKDIIWIGTDDGNVQITKDNGDTWSNLRPNIVMMFLKKLGLVELKLQSIKKGEHMFHLITIDLMIISHMFL